MVLGYARKSTNSQKLDLQVDALLEYGVLEQNIYIDNVSGSKEERKNLDLLLSKLRKGDTLVTWKLDRVGRSVSHLVKLIDDFKEREIHFVSIKEPFINTTTPYGKFIFNIFSSIAELERDIIIERTIAGQESARRRGVQLGRRKGLSKEAKVKARLAANYYRDEKKALTVIEIMKLVGIKSKPTLYRYLAYMGKRNCYTCNVLFWDKDQEEDFAFCEKHINDKREIELLKRSKK